MIRLARSMLAVVLVMALILAPVAGARAMPCHDQAGAGGASASLQMALGDLGQGQHGSHQADHQACCGNTCGLYAVGVALPSETQAVRAATLQRYLWVNQVGTGLVLPPALDPPRLRT